MKYIWREFLWQAWGDVVGRLCGNKEFSCMEQGWLKDYLKVYGFDFSTASTIELRGARCLRVLPAFFAGALE